MNEQVNTESARRKPSLALVLVTLAVIASAGLGWHLLAEPESKPAPARDEASAPASRPASADNQPAHSGSLPVAMRQGRCRALAHHLTGMAGAVDESEVEAKRKMMGLLAGEMMNGYSGGGEPHPTSNAIAAVATAEGRRGLNEAREAFRDTLRSVKGMAGRQAAAKISDSCMGCHARFVRDGGKGISLTNVAAVVQQ